MSPEVTHRFLLSAVGFHQLKRQIDEIAASVPPPPGVDFKEEGAK